MACLSCLVCGVLGVFVAIPIIVKIFIKLQTRWCKSQTCLVGKTTIITGSNIGIGYDTALDFAKRGARVILACRDEKRAEEARFKIIEETGNENVVVRLVDLASFKSVRAFTKKINETEERLDILVNNAGVIGIPNTQSEDDHVLLMQINYFSPFLLTVLLIGLLKKTKNSRIVNVSSASAKSCKKFDPRKVDTYQGLYADYCQSKLCNILFTIELAKRLKGIDVTAYSVYPGGVRTDVFKSLPKWLKICLEAMASVCFKTSEEGAQTNIYCSVAKGIEKYNGEHFEECHRVEPYKTVVPGVEKKLWEITEDLVQLHPEERQL